MRAFFAPLGNYLRAGKKVGGTCGGVSPSSRPRYGRSTDEKKPALKSRFFEWWSAREDYAHQRCAPFGRCCETWSRCARLKPPSEVLHPLSATDEKKPALKSRFFEWWSAREDSNLRPTGPKPVALPSCATRRCGAHLTAGAQGRQSLFRPAVANGDKSAESAKKAATAPGRSGYGLATAPAAGADGAGVALADTGAALGLLHQLFLATIPPSGEV